MSSDSSDADRSAMCKHRLPVCRNCKKERAGGFVGKWADEPVTIPVGVLIRAYGALGAAANQFRVGEWDHRDAERVAALCDRAFDAISDATDEPETSRERHDA